MSIKQNFRQALSELSSNQSSETKTEAKETKPVSADVSNQNKVDYPVGSQNNYSESSVSTEQKPRTETVVKTEKSNDEAVKPAAVITADTQISGAIVTKSHLNISGKVKGNILCEETVHLTGEIEGNVTAKAIELTGAKVKGDLRLKNDASINEGSSLTGNLEAQTAIINGIVKGDMRIHGNTCVKSNSEITGDIYTGSLEIAKGAVINGKVTVIKDGVMPKAQPAVQNGDLKRAVSAAAVNSSTASTQTIKPSVVSGVQKAST